MPNEPFGGLVPTVGITVTDCTRDNQRHGRVALTTERHQVKVEEGRDGGPTGEVSTGALRSKSLWAKRKDLLRPQIGTVSFDSDSRTMLDSIHSIRQTSTTKLEIFVSAYETVPISDVSRRGTAGHSREGQQGSRTRRLLEHPIVQGPVNDPQAFPPFSSVYLRQTRDF